MLRRSAYRKGFLPSGSTLPGSVTRIVSGADGLPSKCCLVISELGELCVLSYKLYGSSPEFGISSKSGKEDSAAPCESILLRTCLSISPKRPGQTLSS